MGLGQCPDAAQIVLLGPSQSCKTGLLQLHPLCGVEVETEAGLEKCVFLQGIPCSPLGCVSLGGAHLHTEPILPTPTHSSLPRATGASLTLQLLPEHGQEDREVDGPWGLLHHGVQLFVLHIDAA